VFGKKKKKTQVPFWWHYKKQRRLKKTEVKGKRTRESGETCVPQRRLFFLWGTLNVHLAFWGPRQKKTGSAFCSYGARALLDSHRSVAQPLYWGCKLMSNQVCSKKEVSTGWVYNFHMSSQAFQHFPASRVVTVFGSVRPVFESPLHNFLAAWLGQITWLLFSPIPFLRCWEDYVRFCAESAENRARIIEKTQ
jgi:hypothetical protein